MYEIYNLDYQQAGNLLTPPSKRNSVWLAFLNACLYPVQWLHDLVFNDYANGSGAFAYSVTNTYTVGNRAKWVDFGVYELINPLPAFVTGTTTGTNNYAVTIPAISTYVAGQYYVITFTNANTGPATLNINGLGAALINLGASSIQAGQALALYYNGSSFDLPDINPSNSNYWYKALNNFIGLRERIHYNSQQLVLEYALNRYFGTNFVQPTGWGSYTYPAPDNTTNANDYINKSDIFIERKSVDVDGFIIGVTDQDSAFINVTDTLYFNNCIGINYNLGKQYNFTIFIPASLASNLGSSVYSDIVMSFANQYVVYGVLYNVATY